MTNEELKVLAVDIIEQKVLGSWMVPDALVARIFVPLSVGAASKLPEDVSCVYEYLDKSMPMTIENYPTFFSLKFLTTEDRERLVPMIERYKLLKQEFFDPK